MTTQVIIVIILSFVMAVIATLAYAVRIVGVRTRRIAVSFAVFNIFALISRTASTIQGPLLSKTIENGIKQGTAGDMLGVFRWILLAQTMATITGALLIPTFIKVFSRAVESFSIHRSMPRLLLHGFSKSGVEQFKKSITKPQKDNFAQLKSFRKVPKKIIIVNLVAFSISTVGVLASLYAGCLNPDLRSTCITLSSVINGGATLLMFIFVDPFVSMLTDDVIRGECSQLEFDRCIIFIVGALIAGTILAQLVLVPASEIIGFIARII
ncbi:MAG: lipid II flippase Amj family protein [Clostridium sp.]|uniref:lipid II flippase Amj family protein n=1 Tax=Clostridium sp. TaxID=1506 RepID=UPI003D6D03F0